MIGIGIVGCGRILNAHLQGYVRLREVGYDGFRITALGARREPDALMFRRRGEGPPPRPPVTHPASGDSLAAPHTYVSDIDAATHVAVYTDYHRLATDDAVDAVQDLTTLALHHQVGLAALQAGKHLSTQKPLAVSVRAGRMLRDAAREHQLCFAVHETARYDRRSRAMQWAVRHGLIGTPHIALTGALGGLWSPDRVVADTPWRHQKLLAGGGGSIDIGVHQFHLLRSVVGEIRWVSATTRSFEPVRHRRDADGAVIETVTADVDDTYLAMVGFDNEAIGQLLWSWAGRGRPVTIPEAPVVFGSEGVLRGDQIESRGGNAEPLLDVFERHASPEERDRLFPYGLSDAFALAQLDWLRAIEGGGQPEADGGEGLRDLACAFAMLESELSGGRVQVDDVLNGRIDTYQRAIDVHYGIADSAC